MNGSDVHDGRQEVAGDDTADLLDAFAAARNVDVASLGPDELEELLGDLTRLQRQLDATVTAVAHAHEHRGAATPLLADALSAVPATRTIADVPISPGVSAAYLIVMALLPPSIPVDEFEKLVATAAKRAGV